MGGSRDISRNKTLSAVPCTRLENAFAWEVETMNDFSPRSIVLQFIELVNQGDLDGMASFVSDDVVFTDILGRVYQEKDFMENYLSAFPNYKIHVHYALQGGNGVAIFGKTSGSHVPPEIEEHEWLVWTAEIEDGLISKWRIYSSEGYAIRS
jgi:hypothetical protein